MITPNQLRNTARFGAPLRKETILEIADRLEQLEHKVQELTSTHHLAADWPDDVNYVLSNEPLGPITHEQLVPAYTGGGSGYTSNNPQDVDYSLINRYDTK
jgi:hypothetical protein